MGLAELGGKGRQAGVEGGERAVALAVQVPELRRGWVLCEGRKREWSAMSKQHGEWPVLGLLGVSSGVSGGRL